MTFAYRTKDSLGNVLDGQMTANSLEEASRLLREDGFQVLSIEDENDELGGLFAKRVSRTDIIYATTQLAIMVDTGITLAAALQGIIAQEKNLTLKRLLGELKQGVESGDDFSDVLERHPKYFDKTYVALVRASEATGTLGEMLERIAGYLRMEVDSRSKVRAAMAYPTIMLVMATSVTIFLLTYILPKFTPLFTRKGIELPKPTIVMMAVSQAMLNHWYYWLAGCVALILGIVYGKRTDPGRRTWDLIKINLPILGTMFRKVAISRSLRTLGTMVRSGVSMLDALRLSGEVAGNYYFEKMWAAVLDQVTSGRQIHEALSEHNLFPPMLVQMISSGEQTGKLDLVLEKVSGYYDREVENSLKTATSLIEPIMICAMGFVVGGIALALLLPIFSLSSTPG